MYPKIYHIGLPKSGTTTVQNLLSMDDRLNLVNKSGYFRTNDWFDKKYDYYDQDKINIESDEGLIIHNPLLAFDRIKRIDDNAIIIVTIREQRSLLLSGYKQIIKRGNYCKSFLCFLSSSQGQNYLRFINYSNLYDYLMQYFNSENIHFLLLEEMVEDYYSYFNRLYSIIGINPPSNIAELWENRGYDKKRLYLKRKFNNIKILHSEHKLYSFESRINSKMCKVTYNLFSKILPEIEDAQWNSNNELLKSIENELRIFNNEFMEKTKINIKKYKYLL